MSAFSSYAFNKSHAAAYAFVSYQTAYLKCHFEKEYMAALLTSVLDNQSKLGRYMAECIKKGIKILPPDVNMSERNFTSTENGIRFGLLAVRNIGTNLVERIMTERKNGHYKSVYDMCNRLYGLDLNRRAVESLIKSGSMDCFGYSRRAMLQGVEQLMRSIEADKKYTMHGQMDLFGYFAVENDKEYSFSDCEEMPHFELLAGEKEVTGMYISGHPLEQYSAALEQKGLVKTYVFGDTEKVTKLDGKIVSLGAMVSNVRKKATKNDQTMAFIEAEDMYGSDNVLVFPKLYEQYQESLKQGAVLKFIGRVSVKESGEVDVIADRFEQLPKGKANFETEKSKTESSPKSETKYKKGLYLRVASMQNEKYIAVRKILDDFKGIVPVIIKETDTGKAFCSPQQSWVSVNEQLLLRICDILGRDNVKYIK